MIFHTLSIRAIDRETPSAVSISFDVPDQLRSDFDFKPGQYLTLKTRINGEEVRRAYSLCTNPVSGDLRVVVKRVDDGLFSGFANDHLKPGDQIEVGIPMGRFTVSIDEDSQRNIMAIAAGSGITPVMSILLSVLEEEPNSRCVLLYGNKSPEETIFLEELTALADKYKERFIFLSAYSQTHVDGHFFGRIDRSIILKVLKGLPSERTPDSFYLCGPNDMIDNSIEVLTGQGFTKEQIYFELFTTAEEEIEEAPESASDGTCQVRVIVDEEEETFIMNKGKTILESALENDIDAPYSCQGGICSTCIAKIQQGEARMRQNNVLTDEEVSEGFVLTCQAEPLSSSLVVDYDDV